MVCRQESSIPTTWQVLLEILRDIELGELAQKIEDFFNINRTPTTPPSLYLVRYFIVFSTTLIYLVTLFLL